LTTDPPSSEPFGDLDTLPGLRLPTAKSTALAPSLEAALRAIEKRAVPAAQGPGIVQEEGPEQLLIRFEAAGSAFAVPMPQVLEIADPLAITRVPGLPDHLPGVANMRGEIVLVIDLPGFLTGRRTEVAARLLLLHREGQIVAAVVIERVLGIAPYDPASFRRAGERPRHALAQHEMGWMEFSGRSYSVVDLVGFLEGPALGLPQAGAS